MARFISVFIIGLMIVGAVDFSAKADEIKEETDNQEIIENKICPVCGGEVSEEMKIQCKHKDKICYVCSKQCAEEFKKDPDGYIERLEEMLEKKSDIEAEKSQERSDRRDTHK